MKSGVKDLALEGLLGHLALLDDLDRDLGTVSLRHTQLHNAEASSGVNHISDITHYQRAG